MHYFKHKAQEVVKNVITTGVKSSDDITLSVHRTESAIREVFFVGSKFGLMFGVILFVVLNLLIKVFR